MGYYVVINDLLDVAHTIEETVSEKWSFQISELMMAMFGYTQCNELAGDSKTEMDNYVCKIQNKYGVDTKQLQSDFVSAVGQYRDMYLSIEPNENGVISQDTLFEQCRYIVQERIELQENYNKLQSALQSIADLYSPSMILNTNGINALFDLMNYKLTSLNEKIQEVENGVIKQRLEGIEQSSVELLSSCKKYQSNEIGNVDLNTSIKETGGFKDIAIDGIEEVGTSYMEGLMGFPFAAYKFSREQDWNWESAGNVIGGLILSIGGVWNIGKSSSVKELLLGAGFENDFANMGLLRKVKHYMKKYPDAYDINPDSLEQLKPLRNEGLNSVAFNPFVASAIVAIDGFGNYQEFKDSEGRMSVGRAVAETVIEADIDIATGVGINAGVMSVMASGSAVCLIECPPAFVIGSVALATWGAYSSLNKISQNVTGKDFGEAIADGIIDSYEYVMEDPKEFFSDYASYYKRDVIDYIKEDPLEFIVDSKDCIVGNYIEAYEYIKKNPLEFISDTGTFLVEDYLK